MPELSLTQLPPRELIYPNLSTCTKCLPQMMCNLELQSFNEKGWCILAPQTVQAHFQPFNIQH